MKNLRFRFVISAACLASIMMSAIGANAAPVQFNQVLQIINAKPDRANTSGFTQLRLADDSIVFSSDGDDDGNKKAAPQQDERVITETRAEIMENDVCDCESPVVVAHHFPYAWLALGAVPLLFLIPRGKDKPTPTPNPPSDTPTPTPTPTPPSMTPTPTPTPTPPGMTPTPTPPGMPPTPTPSMTPTPPPPSMTPTPTPTPPSETPTPSMTPTPTPPQPVPEPVTILLFGTGLASIGMAARRKLSRKDEDKTEE